MTRLRLGMVGGGQGAFIGGVHRMAARLDGCWDLVAGAFSSDADRAHASAAEIGISPDRSYSDFNEMAAAEAAREDGIDAVSIVTPNHLHGPVAEAFLTQGIHVICDKPMTATLEQAERLRAAEAVSRASFFLTHNYTGYPMVRHARALVAEGALGDIRMVQANYLQDWLSAPPDADNKQAKWRLDAAQSGGGAIGDIGTHAHNLLGFVTGQQATAVSAVLSTHVDGREVDDDVRATVTLSGGGRGHIWASQVAIGNENNLTIEVYGTNGSLAWAQEKPECSAREPAGAGTAACDTWQWGGAPRSISRNPHPAGHPEGYLEAFATIYREAAEVISGGQNAEVIGMAQGMEGMIFVDACQRSSRNGAAWVTL